MAEETKPVEVISYKDLVIDKLNEWRHILVERTMKYHEAEQRRSEDPDEVVETQNGPMTLPAIIETRVQPLKEARAHVVTLEKMLEEEAAGTLAGRWSDEQVHFPVKAVTP